MKKTIIEVQGLKKKFKEQEALAGIDFSIQEGEIFGFLGPSGSGKTTTINILTGQLSADAGTAHVLSAPVEKSWSRLVLSAMAVVFMKRCHFIKISRPMLCSLVLI